jgi:hypothetical protein
MSNTTPPTPTPTPTVTPLPTAPKTVTIGTQSHAINGTNIYRSTNYLVYYRSPSTATGTNSYGYEAQVVNSKVVKVADGVGNMAIPTNGYVLSGHGTSRAHLT